MKRYITFLVAIIAANNSCSKIIEIDYEVIDPLYVVVATLSDDGSEVLITKTSAMDEAAQSDPITTAEVSISSNGENFVFQPNSEGVYKPIVPITAVESSDYTLSIEVDGELFRATSHLFAAPTIAEVSFSQQQFTADMNLVFCTLAIQDTAGEENYFRYRFRYFATEVDGEEAKWYLTKEVVDGDIIEVMTHLYTMDRELEDGDEITIEVQAIDKATYEYLTTLSQSSSASTNPTTVFDGGCLGYFSASSLTSYTAIFDYSDL